MEYHNSDGEESNLDVGFKIDITMLDGKVVNAVTDTASTASCPLCGAKPSERNNPDKIRQKTPNPDALNLGLSPLHCYLRTFEYILHLVNKLGI